MTAMPWVYDDGGRAAAGYKGHAGDCVARAIAIATGTPYADVYADLAARHKVRSGTRTARNGVATKDIHATFTTLGWVWVPTMFIGSGTTVHLRADELPLGRIVARCTKHVVAVIDGVAHDTHDPSRGGTRAVYGYWHNPDEHTCFKARWGTAGTAFKAGCLGCAK